MREIKFRGISIDTDKWVYGYGVVMCDVPENELAVIIHQQAKNLMQHTAVKPETVGQFTGLKDLNGAGKEVYESDIFKTEKGFGVVKMFEGCWIVEFPTYQIPLAQFLRNDTTRETCGNIYEHSDLLGDSKNLKTIEK